MGAYCVEGHKKKPWPYCMWLNNAHIWKGKAKDSISTDYSVCKHEKPDYDCRKKSESTRANTTSSNVFNEHIYVSDKQFNYSIKTYHISLF